MGIPKFYNQFIAKLDYYGLILPNLPPNVFSLSIDMNGLIHDAAQQVYAYGEHKDERRQPLVAKKDPHILEKELFDAVIQNINNVVDMVQPMGVLVLAVDGKAPLAKIAQQRQRRYRAALDSSSGTVFDSNAITPGTDFMQKLDVYLHDWLMKNSYRLPPTVIYSSWAVPGEGEHKILDIMRKGDIKNEGNHVIYGLDADLFMLAMASPLDHIFLTRESARGERGIVSIDVLKAGLTEDLNNKNAISDFIIMMFLLGNDFLPHQIFAEDMPQTLRLFFDIYRNLGVSFTNAEKTDLNEDGLAKFFERIADQEHELLADVAMKDYKYPSQAFQKSITTIGSDRAFDFDVFRTYWYGEEFAPRGPDNVITLLEKISGIEISYDIKDINELAQNYRVGLHWVFKYYWNGQDTVNDMYQYRYYHAPLVQDLIEVFNDKLKTTDYLASGPAQGSFGVPEQLLAVLPPKSQKLIPTEFRPLMIRDDSPIVDLFPLNFLIVLSGVQREYQGYALLPPIEMRRITEAVGLIKYDEETYKNKRNSVIVHSAEIMRKRQEYLVLKQKIPTLPSEIRARQYQNRGAPERGRGRGRGSRGRGTEERVSSPSRGSSESRGRGYRLASPQRGRGQPGTGRGRGYRGRGAERGSERGRGFRGRGNQ